MLSRLAVAQSRRLPPKDTQTFPAPMRGWIRNESIAGASPGGAEVLENVFPTPEGARMRRGSVKHATIPAQVAHLASYETGAGDAMFAFDATTISEIASPASATVAPTPAIQQLTSGDFSTAAMATSAGEFLLAANGADLMHCFDGTNWFPLNGNATSGLAYDAGTADFTVGETVTGGTSGATATIVGILDGTTATGTLLVQSISGGPFSDNEAITDGATGSATSDIPSGVTAINSVTITGITTSDASFVWVHKNFVWLIEKDTLNAYYLPVGAIGGAATAFPLRGVFKQGGSLLFGATWSADSGDGRDDFMLFFSDQGEVAIYSGTNPASNFALQGVHKIGEPLGKNAYFEAGGDVAVLTNDGIIPMSSAFNQDRAGLTTSAITYPIEEEWRDIIANREVISDFYTGTLWHRETLLMIGVPTVSGVPGFALVANARTGAWTKYTGWDVRCSVVYNDELYFGDSTGAVFKAETTGADDGVGYSAVWLPRFEDWGDDRYKSATHAVLRARTSKAWRPQLFANADYQVALPTPYGSLGNDGEALWDTAKWDEAVWDAGSSTYKARLVERQAVAAEGQALSAGLQISSGRTQEPDIEFISLGILYQPGAWEG